jgi:fibronectin type 3 domain-containing protein
VKLTWVGTEYAAKYAIYRKAQGESVYKRISISTSNTYTDKSAVDGTYYYYRIWSLNSAGKTVGEWSNAKAITCNKSPTPTLTSIANTANGVKITWGTVNGVAKYAVYRKAEGESKYSRYTITTATSYTDKNAVNGTFYYYRVWSLDASGKALGEWSNAKGITCKRDVTPKISSIANTSSGVKITWGAVPGVAKYAIYRKAEGESKYKRISIRTTTSYVDQSAADGTFYYYRIWSMDSAGNTLGEWSAARGITCNRAK